MTGAGLIAISGIDGSGKTTLARALRQVLAEQGKSVAVVCPLKPSDPTTPIPWVRELSLPPESDPLRQSWIAGYFTLVLCANLQRVILPSLAAGNWVIADRWVLDHQANQDAFGVDVGEWLPVLADAGRPRQHLLVDVPVDMAMRRLAARSDDGIGRGRRFLTRARARMLELADTEPGITILDGTAPPATVLAAALASLPTHVAEGT